VYSTIPLDLYLAGAGVANPPRDAFAQVYAANVLAYAAGLRVPQPATLTVNPAAGPYRGRVTLTATLRSGETNLFGLPVQFSLNGAEPPLQAVTSSSGVATVLNVSLGALDAGTYPVSAASSFTSSTGESQVTVLQVPATIAAVGGTFAYDGLPHPASGTVTGLVVGGVAEPLGVPDFLYTDLGDGATSAAPPVDAGVYAVTALYAGSTNYLAGSNTTQTITITPVPLTVAANNARRLAGTSNPVFGVTYAGFVGADGPASLGGTLSVTTDATPESAAGAYTLTPGGLTSRNYAISFVPGTLTINPFLVIDRTTIGTGIAGLLAQAINADIAAKGLRTPLFTRPTPSAPQGLVLPAGTTFNAGLFKFAATDPQRSLLARWWPNAGLPFTIPEFVAAAGAAAFQINLFAVESVVPLTVADMQALVGKQTCAVVYDSHILALSFGGLSIANLTGKTLGRTAFEVTAVTPHPSGGYHLPSLTVNVLPDAQAVCQ
jgi:hypothetical protein